MLDCMSCSQYRIPILFEYELCILFFYREREALLQNKPFHIRVCKRTVEKYVLEVKHLYKRHLLFLLLA